MPAAGSGTGHRAGGQRFSPLHRAGIRAHRHDQLVRRPGRTTWQRRSGTWSRTRRTTSPARSSRWPEACWWC